jgi:hypothetical protein
VPSAAGTIGCAFTKEGKSKNEKVRRKKYILFPLSSLFSFPPRVEWGLASGIEVFRPEGFATSQQLILPTAIFL